MVAWLCRTSRTPAWAQLSMAHTSPDEPRYGSPLATSSCCCYTPCNHSASCLCTTHSSTELRECDLLQRSPAFLVCTWCMHQVWGVRPLPPPRQQMPVHGLPFWAPTHDALESYHNRRSCTRQQTIDVQHTSTMGQPEFQELCCCKA